jgi:transposase-like protein
MIYMEFPKSLLEAIEYFSDEQVCIDAVAYMRWSDGKAICPDCGQENPYYLAKQKRWKCRKGDCGRQFSVKVGTIFEDSPISLKKWLPAMWLICNNKNGISSWELHRAIGVTQKTAWFMNQRLRLALKDTRTHKFGFGGPVESDETYIGPNPAKMHKDRKAKLQTYNDAKGGYVSKTAVHGILDRELRQVRAKVIPNAKREVLQNAILENVTPFAKVYTDEHLGYMGLEKQFIHKVVDHSREYVNGKVHTQGIENFWSLLKRGLRGTYVAVEPFHLDRYIDEQAFRFNNRATKDNPLTDADRFALALSQIVNKRLTYKELTGKAEERSSEKF